jgi:hypothetical protein
MNLPLDAPQFRGSFVGRDSGTLHLSTADLTAHLSSSAVDVSHVPKPLRCSFTLPHPVVARQDAFLQKIASALDYFGHGPALADREIGERTVAEAIQSIYADHPQAVMAQWSELYRAMYAAVCLAHARRNGKILHATDTLETLLIHSDIEADLPTSMFLPPHPAVYVHFGPQWQACIRSLLGPALVLSGATPEQVTPHGSYLLQTLSHCESCKRTQRTIGLYVVVEFADQPGLYVLFGGADEVLHNEEAPLSETLIRKLDGGVPGGLFGQLPSVLVDLLAKLFLYMQTDAARIVEHNDHKAALQRLAAVGSKKQGKLERRAQRLYDWLEIGPSSGPALGPEGATHANEVAAHWRRGHFRQQACGAQRAQRKPIFIAPTLVRADKLHAASDEPPQRRT